jgi:hypothetical protein
MVALTEKKLPKSDSMDRQEIESQLVEIGVPFLPLSWEDEFLMAENLQNYFAEVIARMSHICREVEGLSQKESEDLKTKKISWITLRNEYRRLNLLERQNILLKLMKENKYLSEKYAY